MKLISHLCKEEIKSLKYLSVLCLVLVFIISDLNAQQLAIKENQWNVAIYPTFTPDFNSYSIRLMEDTLVNGLIYHKIYYSFDSLNTNWVYQNALLREDGFNKVYYKRDNEHEVLLYDFSLNINDTFKINEFCTLQVIDIDTITLNDGQSKKRLKLVRKGEPNWRDEYWIESIGSQFGLINHFRFCETDYSDELLCFYNNNKLLFPLAPISCFLTKNEELTNNFKISFYPNPFNSIIELENINSQFKSFRLTTLTGNVVLSGRLEEAIAKINTEALVSGIYMVIVEAENGKQGVSRLIKY